MSAVPEIIHVVEATLMSVAMPYAPNVREPVVPAEDKMRVSVVMEMVVDTAAAFTITTDVPTSNGTEAFAGMVIVRPVVVM